MTLLLRTYGCRANHYDAEQVRAMAERAGLGIAGSGEAAEFAVFTSCAVTADAEADLRQGVRRLVREQPGVRVIVTGCAAARSPESIGALPNVEAVIPGADLAAVAAALGLARAAVDAAATRQATARATLRVQDGCDEHCTFCATTLARGAHRSRGVDELVREARALSEHHAEIVLTGIHVGSWGKESGGSLGALVRALVERVPGPRFRLASVEATEVDDELRELLRGSGAVCPYLHAPLQSGSDAVLRRMGRHWYTAASYAAALERLVYGVPAFGLGADVMTGFPGETDDDHRATVELVRSLPFTHLHVFPYSARPGTAAVRLARAVPAVLARERAAELRAIGEAKAEAHRAARAGSLADAIVIGPSPHGDALRQALTEDYLEVPLRSEAPRGARLRVRLGAGDAPAVPA